MGDPAGIQGSKITGDCGAQGPKHILQGGSPAPPLPFSAPVEQALVASVVIEGKKAAVQGSNGTNQPAHEDLDSRDPYFMPETQIGRVIEGSSTVFFGGQHAANQASKCTIDFDEEGHLSEDLAKTVFIG